MELSLLEMTIGLFVIAAIVIISFCVFCYCQGSKIQNLALNMETELSLMCKQLVSIDKTLKLHQSAIYKLKNKQ